MVDAGTQSQLLRWIPLLPLAAAAIHGVLVGLLRRESPRWFVVVLSCGAVLLSFALACVALVQLVGLPVGHRLLLDDVYTWIGAGHFSAELAFQFDPLSAVMTLIVTGVGSLIHIYSIGYMTDDDREDGGFQRFFCYLNLFTFAMLLLVLGDNLVVMFLGWEGVGLCSYLLIGFWYGERWNAYCGSKAFIVNRIGDFAFLVGIFLVVWAVSDVRTPTVVFRELQAAFPALANRTLPVPAWFPGAPSWKLATVAGLCFFIGATGKSAQIPLYTWLPDAMAGPTPVSALIHAATMVTAGVYMVCRLSFLYAAAPGASAVIAWTGALTALFAATMAIAQTDIKKVLAYSTVSQLGYMFLAAGCGGYAAAIFHLGMHAFFKALLFLGAGSVILALHHEQDMDKMGGLWGLGLRHTAFVFGVATLAISGIPPFSGFFSKDEVLSSAWVARGIPGHAVLWGIGVFTATLTAIYMFRLHLRIFHGETHVEPGLRSHVVEPGPTVRNPLYVLAFLAFAGGLVGFPQVYGNWFGIPGSNSLARFLAPVLAHGGEAGEIGSGVALALAGIATLAALVGVALAVWLYWLRPELPARIRAALGGAYRLVRDKYYVDEIYDYLIVRPLVAVSREVLYRGVDAGLIDGVGVNGTARGVRAIAARGLKYAQSGLAQAYLFLMLVGTFALVAWLLR